MSPPGCALTLQESSIQPVMTRAGDFRRGRKAVSTMPLDFADFAHHYQGLGLDSAQQIAHFETFSDLMECIVRLFWRDGPAANALGITLEAGSLAFADKVKSDHSLKVTFNGLAATGPAGKKEP